MYKFKLYQSGIFYGNIIFRENGVYHEKLDIFNKELEEEKPLTEKDRQYYLDFIKIDLEELYKKYPIYIKFFKDVKGNEGDKIVSPFNEVFSKYKSMWVQRKVKFPLDIIFLDEDIVGFNCSAREACSVLIKEGYENESSLKIWEERNKEEIYPVNYLGEYKVNMSDGVELATDVYLPKGVKEKLPVILVRTPYGKENFALFHYKYVQRGYALVIQDVRGRNKSDGEWFPMYYEARDGNDTANWIAEQEWSNNKIGMIGGSYCGYVQWALASTGNPYLKAMVSIVTAGGPFTDMPRKGGAFLSGMLAWAFSVSQKIFKPELMERDDWDEVLNIRPFEDMATKALGYSVSFIDEWLSRNTYDEYWEKTDWFANRDKINRDIGTMIVSGWFDDNGMGTTEALDVVEDFDDDKKKLILGPWMHSGNANRDLHGVDFGDNAIRYDLDYNYLLWFDHFLKGDDNGVNKGEVLEYYTVGDNVWRTDKGWPLPNIKNVPMYITSGENANSSDGDGLLTFDSIEEDRKDSFKYDPKKPSNHIIDLSENELSVPENYKDEEKRKDILVYTSDPLKEELTITGDIIVEFYGSSSAVDTDWVVRVLDVDEEGNSIKLVDGILTAKYRNSFSEPELMEKDNVYKFKIRTSKISNTFKLGHRIRFTITSSAKNCILPHSNTEEQYGKDLVVAENTIYHGKKYPSKIILPIESKNIK